MTVSCIRIAHIAAAARTPNNLLCASRRRRRNWRHERRMRYCIAGSKSGGAGEESGVSAAAEESIEAAINNQQRINEGARPGVAWQKATIKNISMAGENQQRQQLSSWHLQQQRDGMRRRRWYSW